MRSRYSLKCLILVAVSTAFSVALVTEAMARNKSHNRNRNRKHQVRKRKTVHAKHSGKVTQLGSSAAEGKNQIGSDGGNLSQRHNAAFSSQASGGNVFRGNAEAAIAAKIAADEARKRKEAAAQRDFLKGD